MSIPKFVRRFYEDIGIPDSDKDYSEFVGPKLRGELMKCRLIPNMITRMKSMEKAMGKYGFHALSPGSNIITFYHEDDPSVVFKVAADSYGELDNLNDGYIHEIFPETSAVFAVEENGLFSVQERKFSFHKRDALSISYEDDMRKFVKKVLRMGWIAVDISPKCFKNYGIDRDGSLCVVDMSDCYPVPEYAVDRIFRCPNNRMVKKGGKIKTVRCGGSVSYDKDFRFLTCADCGETTINPMSLRINISKGKEKKQMGVAVSTGFDSDDYSHFIDYTKALREKRSELSVDELISVKKKADEVERGPIGSMRADFDIKSYEGYGIEEDEDKMNDSYSMSSSYYEEEDDEDEYEEEDEDEYEDDESEMNSSSYYEEDDNDDDDEEDTTEYSMENDDDYDVDDNSNLQTDYHAPASSERPLIYELFRIVNSLPNGTAFDTLRDVVEDFRARTVCLTGIIASASSGCEISEQYAKSIIDMYKSIDNRCKDDASKNTVVIETAKVPTNSNVDESGSSVMLPIRKVQGTCSVAHQGGDIYVRVKGDSHEEVKSTLEEYFPSVFFVSGGNDSRCKGSTMYNVASGAAISELIMQNISKLESDGETIIGNGQEES